MEFNKSHQNSTYNSLITISGSQNFSFGSVILSVPHWTGSQLMNSFTHHYINQTGQTFSVISTHFKQTSKWWLLLHSATKCRLQGAVPFHPEREGHSLTCCCHYCTYDGMNVLILWIECICLTVPDVVFYHIFRTDMCLLFTNTI